MTKAEKRFLRREIINDYFSRVGRVFLHRVKDHTRLFERLAYGQELRIY